jgi:hypothetical protein
LKLKVIRVREYAPFVSSTDQTLKADERRGFRLTADVSAQLVVAESPNRTVVIPFTSVLFMEPEKGEVQFETPPVVADKVAKK